MALFVISYVPEFAIDIALDFPIVPSRTLFIFDVEFIKNVRIVCDYACVMGEGDCGRWSYRNCTQLWREI